MNWYKYIPSEFWLIIILAIALILRIPLLNGSLWLDEAAQALESARPFSQQLQIHDDFQPPLLHYLIHFAMYLGRAEWWLRTVGALIPGLFTIFYTYKIGRLMANKQVAVASALLLATSSFHIFYSQELRQYSLPAALATASWYILIRHWKNNQLPNNLVLITFSLVHAAGLYSSYLYPFAVMGQVLWLIFSYRRFIKRWLASIVGSVILFLPWLPYFFDQLAAGTQLQSALPGWSTTVSPVQIKALPLVVIKFIFGVVDVEVNMFYVLVLAFIGIQIIALFFSSPIKKKEKQSMLPLFCWLVLPILISWVVSFWVPVLQPKRVLFCLPAFYLLITVFASRAGKGMRLLGLLPQLPILISFLLLLNSVGILQYWNYPSLQRENWRQLVGELEQRYPQKSIAVFSFPEPFAPWRWYASSAIAAISTGQLLLDQSTTVSTLEQAIQYDYIITFDYLRDLTDPNHLLNNQLIAYGYKEIEVIDYPVIGFVRIYSRPEAVISYK